MVNLLRATLVLPALRINRGVNYWGAFETQRLDRDRSFRRQVGDRGRPGPGRGHGRVVRVDRSADAIRRQDDDRRRHGTARCDGRYHGEVARFDSEDSQPSESH